MNLDDLIREAMASGYAVVRVFSRLGEERAAVLQHRGHAGTREDRILYDLDWDAYLKLTTEMQQRSTVEMQSASGLSSTAIGQHYFAEGGLDKRRLTAQNQGGHFVAAGTPIAYHLAVDSIGQESWSLHLGYTTSAQLDRWADAKMRLCNELADRVEAPWEDDPLKRLWPVLDRAIDLDDFDLDAWAANEGIKLLPTGRAQ